MTTTTQSVFVREKTTTTKTPFKNACLVEYSERERERKKEEEKIRANRIERRRRQKTSYHVASRTGRVRPRGENVEETTDGDDFGDVFFKAVFDQKQQRDEKSLFFFFSFWVWWRLEEEEEEEKRRRRAFLSSGRRKLCEDTRRSKIETFARHRDW